MTFEVVRVVQGREDEGVIIASGFETEVDAIRYASRKDQEYGLQYRETRYPFTYHTTRVSAVEFDGLIEDEKEYEYDRA